VPSSPLRDRARELRRNDTRAETLLWLRLRNRNLGGWKWKRQVPRGAYIIDFLCSEAELVIEVDGGGHSEQEAYDSGRTEWLEAQGLRVLRFWNHQVLENVTGVCDDILRACGGDNPGVREAEAPAPHLPDADASGPSLSPQAGRGDDGRTRKCIVTGQILPEERLIRFVGGPDGAVVPDLARKLPGRGLWVEATRASVDLAVKKNAFSRAAKAQLKPAADLSDQVEKLLRQRLLQGLGLARRSGELTWGYDRVSAAIAAGRVAWMIEAADGASDGRRKLLKIAAHKMPAPRLIGAFSEAEIGLALGLENVIHLAFLAGRGTERWALDVERLSGFRPLLPESWREEPQDGADNRRPAARDHIGRHGARGGE
jgi:very-short-patch-repair endonuclease/predicted RNA-binding protein YlxR (DUF448 family)